MENYTPEELLALRDLEKNNELQKFLKLLTLIQNNLIKEVTIESWFDFEQISHIFRVMKRNNSVNALYLKRNVDKQHIQSMCSILQTRRINFLKLCGSLCTSSYFVHLVVALQTNYSVEELTIENGFVNCKEFSQMLGKNKSILRLNFFNALSDMTQADFICRGLQENTSIKMLNLSGNKIPKGIVENITQYLRNIRPDIKVISIRSSNEVILQKTPSNNQTMASKIILPKMQKEVKPTNESKPQGEILMIDNIIKDEQLYRIIHSRPYMNYLCISPGCALNGDFLTVFSLDSNFTIEYGSIKTKNVIISAILFNNFRVIQKFVCDGNPEQVLRKINELDICGETPLTAACKSASDEIVLFLLGSRTDKNKFNRFGESPLILLNFYQRNNILSKIFGQVNEVVETPSLIFNTLGNTRYF